MAVDVATETQHEIDQAEAKVRDIERQIRVAEDFRQFAMNQVDGSYDILRLANRGPADAEWTAAADAAHAVAAKLTIDLRHQREKVVTRYQQRASRLEFHAEVAAGLAAAKRGTLEPQGQDLYRNG